MIIQQFFSLLIAVAVILYMLYQQVALKPVRASKYVIRPIILGVITVNAIYNLVGNKSVSIFPLILPTAIGMLSGVISGIMTKIFKGSDGKLYQHGGWRMFLFLLIAIPIRVGIKHTLAKHPGNEILNDAGVSYMVMISSQLAFRSLTIILKAPETWQLFLKERKRRKERGGRRRRRRKKGLDEAQ